jgi:CBS domain-containing protein
MNVKDVMTADPVTVSSEMPLKDVANILVARGISGLPVVGAAGEALGVVSEGDLIAKQQGEPLEQGGGFGWRWLSSRGDDSKERAKLGARTAGEAMTAPPITVSSNEHVAEAARRMVRNGVNRLPVVDEHGTVIGIVTRADLVSVFSRPDQQIANEIEREVVVGTLWVEPSRVKVQVAEGVVTLSGRLDTKLDAELLPRLVGRVPGVVSVVSELTWAIEEEPLPRAGRRGRSS